MRDALPAAHAVQAAVELELAETVVEVLVETVAVELELVETVVEEPAVVEIAAEVSALVQQIVVVALVETAADVAAEDDLAGTAVVVGTERDSLPAQLFVGHKPVSSRTLTALLSTGVYLATCLFFHCIYDLIVFMPYSTKF